MVTQRFAFKILLLIAGFMKLESKKLEEVVNRRERNIEKKVKPPLAFGETGDLFQNYTDKVLLDIFLHESQSNEIRTEYDGIQEEYSSEEEEETLMVAVQSEDCEVLTSFDNPIPIKTIGNVVASQNFTEEIFEKDPELAVYSVPYLGSVNFTCFSNSIHEWFSTAEFYQAQTGSALSASVFAHEDVGEVGQFLNVLPQALNYSHLSTLRLTKMTNRHVGSYWCQTTTWNGSVLAQKIQVYVEDFEHPAAYPLTKLPKRKMKAKEGSPALIPCRPSHPSFRVRLEKNNKPVHFEDGMFYHPRIGFIFPKASQRMHSGTYKCLFSSPHKFEEKRYVNLKVAKIRGEGDTSKKIKNNKKMPKGVREGREGGRRNMVEIHIIGEESRHKKTKKTNDKQAEKDSHAPDKNMIKNEACPPSQRQATSTLITRIIALLTLMMD